MRADTNKIALRAIRSLLGETKPFEVETGTTKNSAMARGDQRAHRVGGWALAGGRGRGLPVGGGRLPLLGAPILLVGRQQRG
jgi:hypothetical protein